MLATFSTVGVKPLWYTHTVEQSEKADSCRENFWNEIQYQTKQDRMRIFEEILFFKATYGTKTNKQFTYLLSVGFFFCVLLDPFFSQNAGSQLCSDFCFAFFGSRIWTSPSVAISNASLRFLFFIFLFFTSDLIYYWLGGCLSAV